MRAGPHKVLSGKERERQSNKTDLRDLYKAASLLVSVCVDADEEKFGRFLSLPRLFPTLMSSFGAPDKVLNRQCQDDWVKALQRAAEGKSLAGTRFAKCL